jgi:hypothetical protein
MRPFLKLAVVIGLGTLPVCAQSVPFQPVPTVRVKLTDGIRQWYEPLPVRHRTADRGWWATTIISAGLTFGDVENSLYALHRPGTVEVDPVFGKHPTRAKYYAIALPGLALAAWFSYHDKREDDALRDAGLPGHRYVKWWLYPLINGGEHLIGISVTTASTGR